MRTLAILALLIFAYTAKAEEPWEQTVPVPEGVHYKQSDAVSNRPTVDRVRALLSAGYHGDATLSDKVLLCGPFLWRRLSAEPALGGGKGIPAIVRVPTGTSEIQLPSRGFKEAPLRQAVESCVRTDLAADGAFRIRKLSPDELKLLWITYPTDLEDPLLMVESAHHKFVLVFIQGNLFEVDDFYGIGRSAGG